MGKDKDGEWARAVVVPKCDIQWVVVGFLVWLTVG